MTSSNTVYMRLGKFGFSLATLAYDALQRRTTANFASNARHGTNAGLQYVGFSDVMTLKGELIPHFRGGLIQLPKMREMLKAGEPLLMVDGRGFVHGEWVIKGVSSDESEFISHGVAGVVGFQIDLEFYGD